MASKENSENESILTEASENSSSLNELKRPVIEQDDTVQTKRVRLSDASDSAPQSPLDFNAGLSPELFLEDFFLPCLEHGNEKTLIHWLLDTNILKRPIECQVCHSQQFELVEGETLEEYSWLCRCSIQRLSIKNGSFFARLECSIIEALKCIVSWCERRPVADSYKGKKGSPKERKVIRRIYWQILEVVYAYLAKEVPNGIVLGGPGSIALLDTWPNGYIHTHSKRKATRRKYTGTTLWIADTKSVPVQCWAHLLPDPKSQLILNSNISFKLLECNKGQPISLKTDLETCALNPSPAAIEEKNLESIIEPREHLLDQNTVMGDMRSQKHRENRILREQQEIQEVPKKQLDGKICNIDSNFKKLKRTDRKKNQEKTKEFSENEEEEGSPNGGLQMDAWKENENFTALVGKESSAALQCQNSDEKEWRVKENENVEESGECTKIKELMDCILSFVNNCIAPGSIVIANDEAIPDICDYLRSCGKYDAVMSYSELLALDDTGHTPTKSILDRIWHTATDVCTDMKDDQHPAIIRKIALFKWKVLVGENLSVAAYHILHLIGKYHVDGPSKASSYYDFK